MNRLSRIWSACENRSGKQDWVRVIYRDGRPLITRYYLCSTRWIEESAFFHRHHRLQRLVRWASFRIVIHHMHASDADGLHDHPWVWASWILSGGYWETTPAGRYWRWPGHLRFRSAMAQHRLELDPSNTRKEVYSLFFMGPRQREWGFVDRNQGWVPWYEHDGLQPKSKETMMNELKFYEQVFSKMNWEGLDYYVQSYASPDHFEGDPELQAAFVAARGSLNRFEQLVEQRIEELGGKLEEI